MKIKKTDILSYLGYFLHEADYQKIQFVDLFIGLLSKDAGCSKTITFDKKAAKSNLFELLK